jgi:hypothetical protein
LCKDRKGKKQNRNSEGNRWDQAIEDAKDTISKCERKIASMKTAIVIFKQSRDEGLHFPERNRKAVIEPILLPGLKLREIPYG